MIADKLKFGQPKILFNAVWYDTESRLCKSIKRPCSAYPQLGPIKRGEIT